MMNREKSKYASNPRTCQPTDRQLAPLGVIICRLWSSARRVGCGQAASRQFPGNVVLDCRYSLSGNINGNFPIRRPEPEFEPMTQLLRASYMRWLEPVLWIMGWGRGARF